MTAQERNNLFNELSEIADLIPQRSYDLSMDCYGYKDCEKPDSRILVLARVYHN